MYVCMYDVCMHMHVCIIYMYAQVLATIAIIVLIRQLGPKKRFTRIRFK